MSDCAGKKYGILWDECEAVTEGGDIDVFEGLVVYVNTSCFGTSYAEKGRG